jgi:hypothetical protein
MCTIFCFEKVKGRDHSEDLDSDGKIMLEIMLGKYGGRMLTGCIWIGIRTSGGMW